MVSSWTLYNEYDRLVDIAHDAYDSLLIIFHLPGMFLPEHTRSSFVRVIVDWAGEIIVGYYGNNMIASSYVVYQAIWLWWYVIAE
jgi:hypothetical protein